MFSWSSQVVKCDGLFVKATLPLSKHSSPSSENESVGNFSPLCGPAEKGTQIALLSRPRQEAIICALLNLLFFFIQSVLPSTRKALQSQMRSCEFHCSRMEMRMCPLEAQSTAQVLLFSVFPRPSDQPFRNKPTFANACVPKTPVSQVQPPVREFVISKSGFKSNWILNATGRLDMNNSFGITCHHYLVLFVFFLAFRLGFPPSQVEDVVDMTLRSVAE